MPNKETKVMLDREELALQNKLREGLTINRTDLWPAVKAAVEKDQASAVPERRGSLRIPRRTFVLAAALVAALALMGAGILNHWFIYDSAGNKTTLAEDEGFAAREEYAVMKPAASQDADGNLRYAYDWVDDDSWIPGGLQIPGNSTEERNIPGLRQSLKLLPAGTLAEISANGARYTAVQGSFSTDYETCRKTVLPNSLGIRLPDVSMIPGEYNEHLSFTAGYYVTEKDYAARKELASESADLYTLKSFSLPDSVQNQIGWYALEWFRADKSPVTYTVHLAETDEMYFPTKDEADIVKSITVEGFDKAVCYEQYNKAFDAQEISVILWQKIDPVKGLDLGYSSAPAVSEKHYAVYILDAVGLTEEEAVRIAAG